MYREFWLYLIVASEIFLITISGCKKDKNDEIPEINTVAITLITPVSASCNAILTSGVSSEIVEKGVCWSQEQSASISDFKTSESPVSASAGFTSALTGLTSNTTYFVRAYATSKTATVYGNELSFTTPVDHSGEKGTVSDIEGNVYQTIGIGSQIWTAENMRTTSLKNDTSILIAKCYRIWNFLTSPGYCWYNNDESFGSTYGALYNWYTVNTGKLCPSGWHVPDEVEWTLLETFLGGGTIAAGKMMTPGSPVTGETNLSGFSAIPSGYRGDLATFLNSGENCLFWTSSSSSADKAVYRCLNFKNNTLTAGSVSIVWGASVRCVKN